ncbi:undecaprenyl-phosphate glucose phosphotransferase [Suttonella ornithocola]|uniref:Colanic biosynthesis UDP-glucose lipid carrier transferase n=1 Tax=Suttonella ornithocola TaxID=279832 RepID=A0A380MSI4_9GAMM|nr:undecaprenyl-phosphate glucose phosphotransferase [Suttonella ornithocola]SUO95540.1 Putative colanic biosynthesis UDP-glucose lipid carrier transferase [Suttonella ornithocola]
MKKFSPISNGVSPVISYASWLAKLNDLVCIYFAGFITFYLYFHYSLWDWERYHWMVLLGSILGVSLLSICKIYQSWRGTIHAVLIVRLFKAFFYLSSIIVAYLYLTKTGEHFSRLWFVWWLVSAFGLCLISRTIVYWLLKRLRFQGYNRKTVALFGSKAFCRDLYRAVHRDPLSGFAITYVRLVDDDTATFVNVADIKKFNALEDGDLDVHEIWLCLSLSEGEIIEQMMQTLCFSTANIRLIPDLRTFRLINHQASYVVGFYAFDLSVSPMAGWQRIVKWIEDKIISIVALLLLIPLFLLIGLWILVIDGRPIFYKQKRVSWNGKVFEILKFRTMKQEHEKNEISWGNADKKPVIPLGRVMRRFSIDELPQFWNVLKGDMSIVGPRPERPEFVEGFKREIPGYMQKHMVKAGITGWAQAHGWRGDTDLQQRINHDLWYIENWSLWLDLRIILMTAFRMFFDSSAK